MNTWELEDTKREAELQTENARLQKLVAELIARNHQLRQALDAAIARK